MLYPLSYWGISFVLYNAFPALSSLGRQSIFRTAARFFIV